MNDKLYRHNTFCILHDKPGFPEVKYPQILHPARLLRPPSRRFVIALVGERARQERPQFLGRQHLSEFAQHIADQTVHPDMPPPGKHSSQETIGQEPEPLPLDFIPLKAHPKDIGKQS